MIPPDQIVQIMNALPAEAGFSNGKVSDHRKTILLVLKLISFQYEQCLQPVRHSKYNDIGNRKWRHLA